MTSGRGRRNQSAVHRAERRRWLVKLTSSIEQGLTVISAGVWRRLVHMDLCVSLSERVSSVILTLVCSEEKKMCAVTGLAELN